MFNVIVSKMLFFTITQNKPYIFELQWPLEAKSILSKNTKQEASDFLFQNIITKAVHQKNIHQCNKIVQKVKVFQNFM